MYLIKKDNQYLTKNKYPNSYLYPKDKYIWTRSYWHSYVFSQIEAEQLITEYGGSMISEFKENNRLFKDFQPYNRVAFPNTL